MQSFKVGIWFQDISWPAVTYKPELVGVDCQGKQLYLIINETECKLWKKSAVYTSEGEVLLQVVQGRAGNVTVCHVCQDGHKVQFTTFREARRQQYCGAAGEHGFC